MKRFKRFWLPQLNHQNLIMNSSTHIKYRCRSLRSLSFNCIDIELILHLVFDNDTRMITLCVCWEPCNGIL